jgi:hypothetical protein
MSATFFSRTAGDEAAYAKRPYIPGDNYRLRTGEGQDGGMREGHFGCTGVISDS